MGLHVWTFVGHCWKGRISRGPFLELCPKALKIIKEKRGERVGIASHTQTQQCLLHPTMVSLPTWFRYFHHKVGYSVSLAVKNNKGDPITAREINDAVWKNFFLGKLTYLLWNKGEEMAPTIDGKAVTLVRKLPAVDPTSVFVGDVVVMKDPEKPDNYLLRRLTAIEGYEVVSTDEKDEPFILEKDQCWVEAENEKLNAKEAKDSRTFGPVQMTDIVGRVIYCLRSAVDHGRVQNSDFGMRNDTPVLEVELDVDEMAKRCGMAEGKCLPCSGVSGRTAAVYSYSSLRRIHSHVQVRGLKCGFRGASFVCEAKRNPDFSRQNKHGSSRSRNRNSDGRDSFESFDDDMFSLKNGPPVSLSTSGKFQATSAPGPREKEIVELFRKVQARLRERAASKEEKKVEASRAQSKENSTVDSLLKLLKKHSVEQVKRSSGGRGKDFSSDQLQESNQYDGGRNSKISDLDSSPKDEPQEDIVFSSSVARPRSNFQRRSPVPRLKYQPVSNDENEMTVVPVGSEDTENNQDQIDLKLDDEAESDFESDVDSKDELFFPNIGMAELSEDDDSEQTYNDESVEEQPAAQHKDLSALKLSELRALAKTRGLKGFSKMKKSDLVELLTES
ncbi:SAP-like protein BP-73 [Glycine soja]